MIVTVACAFALVATLLLIRHLAARYPAVPARVPLRIELDGRPSRREAGKWTLWIAPAVLLAVIGLLGVLCVVEPPRADQRTASALVFVVIAQVAWYVAWLLDRQIELARKTTDRIAPGRLFRATVPLLAIVALTIAVAARSG